MITFKTVFINHYNQKIYNSDINTIDISKIQCTCGSVGRFHKHATYCRYLVLDPSKEAETLDIQRIKCESCHTTHALLPSIIIPYRILSNPLILKLFQSFRMGNQSITFLSKVVGLSYECTRKLLIFYKRHHEQRLLSLFASYANVTLNSDIFLRLFYEENRILFMQRISTRNKLLYFENSIPITV